MGKVLCNIIFWRDFTPAESWSQFFGFAAHTSGRQEVRQPVFFFFSPLLCAMEEKEETTAVCVCVCVCDFVRMWFLPPPPSPPLSLFATAETMSRKLIPIFCSCFEGTGNFF